MQAKTVLEPLSKICSDSSVPAWQVCPLLPSHIQGPIEVVKVDQEGWKSLVPMERKNTAKALRAQPS